LAIARKEGLSLDAVEVETRAIALVENYPDRLVAEYRKRFGILVGTDLARELFPDYVYSTDNRLKYAAAVQHSAARIADLVFATIVGEESGGGALFTAGGTGAGKTSAILLDAARNDNLSDARVIFDSNFNSLKSALAKVSAALDAGCKVIVIFVHRHPVEAYLQGVLTRAIEQGRTVPIDGHLRMHRDSLSTFLKAHHKLEDNENTAFRVLVNTGHESELSSSCFGRSTGASLLQQRQIALLTLWATLPQ
jgi:hypothetical protein